MCFLSYIYFFDAFPASAYTSTPTLGAFSIMLSFLKVFSHPVGDTEVLARKSVGTAPSRSGRLQRERESFCIAASLLRIRERERERVQGDDACCCKHQECVLSSNQGRQHTPPVCVCNHSSEFSERVGERCREATSPHMLRTPLLAPPCQERSFRSSPSLNLFSTFSDRAFEASLVAFAVSRACFSSRSSLLFLSVKLSVAVARS